MTTPRPYPNGDRHRRIEAALFAKSAAWVMSRDPPVFPRELLHSRPIAQQPTPGLPHLAGMCRTPCAVLVWSAIVVLGGCSHQKTMSADELHSQIISGISLSAETEMFLHVVRQGRTTRNCARGHLDYLANQAKRSKGGPVMDSVEAKAGASSAPNLWVERTATSVARSL